MKYIDAYKLIAEIKRYKNKADERLKIKGRTFSEERKDLALQNLCGNLLYFVTSLQQEQPEPVKGKFVFPKFLYARTLDNKTIDVSYGPQDITAIEYVRNDFVEQPEVDLEKFTDKVNAFKAIYKYPESISIKGAMAFMARMFYQYPNVARQWYDRLPKATMD